MVIITLIIIESIDREMVGKLLTLNAVIHHKANSPEAVPLLGNPWSIGSYQSFKVY